MNFETRAYSDTLQKDGVVTARSQNANSDAPCSRLHPLFLHSSKLGIDRAGKDTTVLASIPECTGGVGRVRNFLGSGTDEVSERRRGLSAPAGARDRRVEVEISDDIAINPVSKVFAPFGTADEAIL